MSRNLIRLRYSGSCSVCKCSLQAGSLARWNREQRSATCENCCNAEDANPKPDQQVPASDSSRPSQLGATAIDPGVAGASARAEFERRHKLREAKIEKKWGSLAGVVKFLSDDPPHVTAWAKGSEGERRLGANLERETANRAVILHDRKVPRTRGNIDHIAIAPSGIWVIDAKNYQGLVEHRDIGGWFHQDFRIKVGGRDQTKLAEGLKWQIDAVKNAIPTSSVPVTGVLCFTDAEWRLFTKPFRHGEIWVTWPKKLIDMILTPAILQPDEITQIAGQLSQVLKPSVPRN